MQTIAPELSRKMANMSVIAAFMVVVLHAGEPSVMGSGGWWWAEICKMASKIAVPYFFVAAGFFLAGHENESGWWQREVAKRIKTLLIPFLAWCALWWSFYLPFGMYADYLHSRELGSSLSLFEGKWTKILGLNLFQCPFYSPMWFLRALFLMVVASPVVSYIVKRSGGGVILLFIAYWIVCPDASRNDEWRWFFRYGVSLFGIFWFALGMFIRNKIREWTDLYPWGKRGAVAALGISMCLLAVATATNLRSFNVRISVEPIFILFALYGVFFFVPASKWAEFIARNAFPVYLLHSFFVFIIGFVLTNQDSWMILTARVLVAFLFSLCGAIATRRLFPRLAAVLFGGR